MFVAEGCASFTNQIRFRQIFTVTAIVVVIKKLVTVKRIWNFGSFIDAITFKLS